MRLLTSLFQSFHIHRDTANILKMACHIHLCFFHTKARFKIIRFTVEIRLETDLKNKGRWNSRVGYCYHVVERPSLTGSNSRHYVIASFLSLWIDYKDAKWSVCVYVYTYTHYTLWVPPIKTGSNLIFFNWLYIFYLFHLT